LSPAGRNVLETTADTGAGNSPPNKAPFPNVAWGGDAQQPLAVPVDGSAHKNNTPPTPWGGKRRNPFDPSCRGRIGI